MNHRTDTASQANELIQYGVEQDFGFLSRFITTQTGVSHTSLRQAVDSLPSVSLDFSALNVFFRTGLFLNGATPFREIRRCQPPPVFVAATSMPRESAIQAYIDLFRQAVQRRVQPNSGMGLSGGCDSRHILLELHRQKRLPDYAVTVVISGRPTEVSIASELALRTGLKLVIRLPEPRQAVSDELWKNEACDFMSLEHGWIASVCRERDSLPWWDGIAGDVLSAGLFLEECNLKLFRGNRLDELAERLVPDCPVPCLWDQSLFARDDALAEIRAELSRHQAAPNPVGSFYFWNRTRVDIASSAFGLLRPSGQTTLTPYLDKDLWPFLASLPGELLLDHSFHRDTISRAYPEFAQVPYFKEKANSAASAQRAKLWSLLRYLGKGKKDLKVIGIILQAVRALLDPHHIHDIDWLLPFSVYCTQIRRIADKS